MRGRVRVPDVDTGGDHEPRPDNDCGQQQDDTDTAAIALGRGLREPAAYRNLPTDSNQKDQHSHNQGYDRHAVQASASLSSDKAG